jgi:hypothetical protein
MEGGRKRGGQDSKNECNISTALVDYDRLTLTSLTLAATFYSHFQLEYQHSQSRKRGIDVINTQARPRQLGTRPLWWRSRRGGGHERDTDRAATSGRSFTSGASENK